jgi:choline transport protein
MFCALLTAIICVINIASSVAFNAIVSLTIAGLFISYLIPITLLAIKRITDPSSIPWGPWKLGRFGLLVNIFSVAFLMVSVVFSFFPPLVPVTLESMNWSCLVFSGAVLLGLVFYIVSGRKVYRGPIIERPILATDRLSQ